MIGVYLNLAIAGFIIALVILFALRKISLKSKLLLSNGGIPLIGGSGIVTAFILTAVPAFFSLRNFSPEAAGILSASLLMYIFGLIDDRKELSVIAKFTVQIIATAILVVFGVRTQIAYIGYIANILITFIWVLGITNAVNHLDVMDGLSAGTSIIISAAFLMMAALNSDTLACIFCSILIGAVSAFLLYNLPPAKIYMGNSGSHLLGFVLSAIALIISYAPLERRAALLAPLLVLGLPIFDTAFLILMRLKQGRSIFKKSQDHLPLRFLKIGYSKRKTLFVMVSMAFLFSLSGVIVSRASNFSATLVTIIVILAAFYVMRKMAQVKVNA